MTNANTDEQSGFVAGTLIHTQNGLKPIEQIQVRDWVLSKSELDDGEQAYKRVTKMVSFENKDVWSIRFYQKEDLESAGSFYDIMNRIVATPDYPFWVVGKGWTALRDVYTNDQIFLENGKLAIVSDVNLLFKSNLSNALAFERSDRLLNIGDLIDFEGDDSFEFFFPRESIFEPVHVGGDYDNPDTFFRTKVYNFEVEDFHTHYIATKGVWSHNTSRTINV